MTDQAPAFCRGVPSRFGLRDIGVLFPTWPTGHWQEANYQRPGGGSISSEDLPQSLL